MVERLKRVAEQREITLPQLAVAWTLVNPAVQVAIVGARSVAQLDETAAEADIALSDTDLKEIDEVLRDAVPVLGPRPKACETS